MLGGTRTFRRRLVLRVGRGSTFGVRLPVSAADREKWDERYRLGAYEDRTHPSAWLEQYLPGVTVGRALDVPCGAGRNAIFLASRGFSVTGIDISAVALARAEATARARGLSVDWVRRDLDAGHGVTGTFELIVVIHYVDLDLLSDLARLLAPGGHLVVELHLSTDQPVAGPRDPAFRVAPGALRDAAGRLDILDYSEEVVEDPDGRTVALARLAARQPR